MISRFRSNDKTDVRTASQSQNHDCDHQKRRNLVENPEKTVCGVSIGVSRKRHDKPALVEMGSGQQNDEQQLGQEPPRRKRSPVVDGECCSSQPGDDHGRRHDEPEKSVFHDLEQ